MALDRLDAIVIGASVEGLVAAAVLAQAGRQVAVVEREVDPLKASSGKQAVIGLGTARALDLTAHGLRFAPPPPVAAVAGDRALVLWPELHAARSAIAAFSPRDAEALESFHARLARAARGGRQLLVNWLATVNTNATPPSDQIVLRTSSIARVLDEAFDNDLLKGLWAQGAVMGTGVSPLAPATGVLLTRLSILAGVAPEQGHRFVAGGEVQLKQALLARLKFFNNADVLAGAAVKELATERDAVQAVTLTDGTSLRSPLVFSTLAAERTQALLVGLRRPPRLVEAREAPVEPAHVKLTLGAVPKFPGVDAATAASGAIVRLAPSVGRLVQAHAAFRRHALSAEPCLDITLAPQASVEGKQRWDMHITMAYLPPETTEGPWVGNRRDRIRSLCVRTVEAMAPGFGAGIETAEIVHPAEAETVMSGGPLAPVTPALDLAAVPQPAPLGAATLAKGLTLIEASLYANAGDRGYAAADAALGPRTTARGRADA